MRTKVDHAIKLASRFRRSVFLRHFRSRDTLADMSAVELLEIVKGELALLPVEERERFLDGLVALEGVTPFQQSSTGDRVQWPNIHQRHRHIFGDRVLPENIVLAAREEEDH